ncbi:Com family DNA-binding transcriptional regulator [uncultured Ralstonia sp.]|uniref:Com family DNA-binding transcriptional regulator n=1 Tax=uncultured Ralstonia sp. TaxID=114715 RepID=UPI0025ECE117|nr:Com family DNA-binding transcriptional regulator [uncultured Ralstonia sp.]
MHTNDIRCGHCGRKLASGHYVVLTIKCPRCRGMNHLRAESPEQARPRAPENRESHGRESDHSMAGRQAPPG